MALISGVSYQKIVSVGVESYELLPFDSNGNLFPLITINVDTTGGAVTINLPHIETLLNDYNTQINIIRSAGTNNVVVACYSGDKIGSATSSTLNAIGKSLELKPIEASNWYGVLTA